MENKKKSYINIDLSEEVIRFELSPDITPETLSDICISLGFVYTGNTFKEILENNGHNNVVERFESRKKAQMDRLTELLIKNTDETKRIPLISALYGLENVKKITSLFPR